MSEDVKLSEDMKEHLLEDLKVREARLSKNLDEHNSRPGMQKKETYEVQGFSIKGITMKHAIKRMRTILISSGFHPSVTAQHFPAWYEELKKVEKND